MARIKEPSAAVTPSGAPAPMSASEWVLIWVQGLWALASAVAAIFFNLYIFAAAGFEAVIVYTLVTLACLYPMYVLTGYLLRAVSVRVLIQSGSLLLGLVYAAVFFLSRRTIGVLVPLAVVAGLGQGLYWSGVNVAIYMETSLGTRTRFFSRVGPVTMAAGASGPLLGGAIVGLATLLHQTSAGYAVVFAGLSLANLAAALLSQRLEAYTGIRFTVRDLFRRGHEPIRLAVLTQQAVKGLWDNASTTLWVLLMVGAVGSASLVSVVATAASVGYAGSSLIGGRLLNRSTWFTAIGVVFVPTGVMLFAFTTGWWEAAVFVFLVRLPQPLQDIPVQTIIFDTLDDIAGPWQRKFGHLVEREIALGGARVISFGVMAVVFAHGNDAASARTIVMGLAACPLGVGLLQLLLDRRRAAAGSAPPPVDPAAVGGLTEGS